MGANDRGAIDHRGKRPGGKRPGGKWPGGKRPGGKWPGPAWFMLAQLLINYDYHNRQCWFSDSMQIYWHIIMIITIIQIIIVELAVFNVAGYLIEERHGWPVITADTIFQINSKFWKKGTVRWENRTSCLVGLKTHPTAVRRSGIEFTTSRLQSVIITKVSHALNHSAIEAVNRPHSVHHNAIDEIYLIYGNTALCDRQVH